MIFFDIIGWIGMITVLTAYLLLSFGIIKNNPLYQWMNLFAALCMAIGLYPKNAWFSFALQIAWGIIAIVSLIKMKSPKNKKKW